MEYCAAFVFIKYEFNFRLNHAFISKWQVWSGSKNGWFLTICNHPYLDDFFMTIFGDDVWFSCLYIEQNWTIIIQFWMILVIHFWMTQTVIQFGWFLSSTFGRCKLSSNFGWFLPSTFGWCKLSSNFGIHKMKMKWHDKSLHTSQF